MQHDRQSVLVFMVWGILFLGFLGIFAHDFLAGKGHSEAEKERVNNALGRLSLPFIANQGQVDKDVAYYAPTFAGTVFVTHKGEVVYGLPGKREVSNTRDKAAVNQANPGWSIVESFIDGKSHPLGQGVGPARVSYFLAGCPRMQHTVFLSI